MGGSRTRDLLNASPTHCTEFKKNNGEKENKTVEQSGVHEGRPVGGEDSYI